MAKPDFSNSTKIELAKRAAYLCSNPDCRVTTVGPNENPTKSTSIGEAAHIYAARPNGSTPRYNLSMTDAARAEITNGIWLCTNCHRTIDNDPRKYPADLLFAWREKHETYVRSNLGKRSDKFSEKLVSEELLPFASYPAIVRRIVIDKPEGWELRLTAELLRYLNQSHFRRMRDLRDGLYTETKIQVEGWYAATWIDERLGELADLFGPIERVLNRLVESWGAPGEPGNLNEIHHNCKLFGDALARVIEHEEKVHFATLPKHFEPVQQLLKNNASSQAEKLHDIPTIIDQHLELFEQGEIGKPGKPMSAFHTIDISLPKGWSKRLSFAIDRANRIERGEKLPLDPSKPLGFFGWLGVIFWLVIIIVILV
ncbi:hypothetical protein MXMO3_02975 [Maritalea myrionectae]|uniref:HNH endonuclease n=1 Tax=Maritalea myrionectae TaxID=454601 RepID=A0A2R4MHR9_9HYPH|nr:HNH endonuclease [Maritalea myrionectae]AVX05483.1 hypothetical protein MXMO3_02975 [Maritalea myrionectae]